MQFVSIVVAGSILPAVLAGPVLSGRGVNARAGNDLVSILSSAASNPQSFSEGASQSAAVVAANINKYLNVDETSQTSSVKTTFDTLVLALQNGSTPDVGSAAEQISSNGLIFGQILELINGYTDSSLISDSNVNTRSPDEPIYPSKSSSDAPYSVSESDLRSAIYIPSTFSYGADGKEPIILIPGTGVPAGLTYYFTFSKLPSAVNVDPVWVNIPKASLGDAQVNAEYVAYAINYISGVSSNSNVSVLSWSQGGLDTQWALKYWPSTRSVVSDFIPMSPDFKGTIEADFLCPGIPTGGCTPSIAQQTYYSTFIDVLRSNGGDSAYVPTTVTYSSFDEIVEPQSGTTTASAFLLDARSVGVTDNWIQTICPLQPAGSFYTHEGVLYNPLAWALAIDALTHDGPGDVSRIDLPTVCEEFIPPELDLADVLGIEGTMLVALAEIISYGSTSSGEPPIMPYAESSS